ncbi:hypothetical protein RQP46_008481 [Phenoliferia psychrophenolica]
MKLSSSILAVAATLSVANAFPHMLRDLGLDNMGEFKKVVRRDGPDALRNMGKRAGVGLPTSIPLPALPIPGLNLPGLIDIPGILTVGTKIIPDAAHPFQEPGPGDQRGGCPGLNIMSNYGYMPRNGITSAGDIVYGCVEMLGYSVDLALVLVALAIRAGAMDLTTLKMSIGTKDSRTDGPLSLVLGSVPGLFDIQAHNRYEIDGSMAYDDEYFHKGVGNAGGFFNGTRFAKLQAFADANGGLYTLDTIGQHRQAAYQECIATNPTCTWNVVGQILFYGADGYTYLGMSSTDPATGMISPPDSKSVQTFFGVQKSGNTFIKTAEKLPPGPDGHWYRRSTPLTTAEIAGDAVTTYASYPTDFGSNNGQAVNTFTPSTTQLSGTGAGAFCIGKSIFQRSPPSQPS